MLHILLMIDLISLSNIPSTFFWVWRRERSKERLGHTSSQQMNSLKKWGGTPNHPTVLNAKGLRKLKHPEKHGALNPKILNLPVRYGIWTAPSPAATRRAVSYMASLELGFPSWNSFWFHSPWWTREPGCHGPWPTLPPVIKHGFLENEPLKWVIFLFKTSIQFGAFQASHVW